MNEKITKEVADQEFDRWVEAMGLARKLDPSTLNDEDKKSLADSKKVLIGAMLDGNLLVNDNGELVFQPKFGEGEPITFYEPTGASLMASDAVKMGAVVQKQFKVLADMTKTSVARFSSMKNRDLSVCLAISAFFLAT
jgi:hypothetical protein